MRVDLQSNLVTLEVESRVQVSLAAIPAAIHDAGFRPGTMRIRALGAAELGAPARFRIAAWAGAFPMDPSPASTAPFEIEAQVVVDQGVTRLIEWRSVAR